MLMYEALSAEQTSRFCAAVDHFVPDSAVASYSGTSIGANRVDLCRGLALRGVVGADAAKLALARDALSPVFPYGTSGDGLHADGSFIQHTTVPYTGSYGAVLLGGLGLLLALLDGSRWEVRDGGKEIVLDAVEGAWALPSPPAPRGRGRSRTPAGPTSAGTAAMSSPAARRSAPCASSAPAGGATSTRAAAPRR
ncbi:hypothetical protein AT728_23595 [Streptomyces silvensis]|uniref:Polysaccharide lyase 8 N-terminal alpha-helical domain-containing protein n=1 Tax=Streptomyces silvensis TaxID=1765722 RepID=A0A0W7X252_9ACTN|nr:hypothetical protein AT728_23595 [Streptomyces silvensis]